MDRFLKLVEATGKGMELAADGPRRWELESVTVLVKNACDMIGVHLMAYIQLYCLVFKGRAIQMACGVNEC